MVRGEGMIMFVAAEARECRDWVARWSNVHDPRIPGLRWARAGEWKGRNMLAIANGAGVAHAAMAVRSGGSLQPEAVYSIGYCGALDSSLAIGDIFVATEIRGRTPAIPVNQPRCAAAALSGPLITAPAIVQTAAAKRELRQTGALAVEMEAAGAAAEARELGVPFYCVRVVSDLADEDFANDLNACMRTDLSLNLTRLMIHAMGKPVERFGELLRLSRRAALASRNSGNFLADCTY